MPSRTLRVLGKYEECEITQWRKNIATKTLEKNPMASPPTPRPGRYALLSPGAALLLYLELKRWRKSTRVLPAGQIRNS